MTYFILYLHIERETSLVNGAQPKLRLPNHAPTSPTLASKSGSADIELPTY